MRLYAVENLKNRLAGTYSIVAADPERAEMGVGVQSHFFAVGSAVPWIEPGVGVIATQSLVNRQYGPDGLALLRRGHSAEEVVEELTRKDEAKEYRQLAVLSAGALAGLVDAEGENYGESGITGLLAAHTGDKCIREAGDTQGRYYSVQANMMEHPGVPEAMAQAFEESEGALGERILAALEAAEGLGGDIRGKQSASLYVASIPSRGQTAYEMPVNLRIDDNPEPLAELRRLLSLNTAYLRLDEGDSLLSAGKHEEAMTAYRRALDEAPGNEETMFWEAVALLGAGAEGEAARLLYPLVAKHRGWFDLLGRLEEADLASFPEGSLEKLREKLDGY